MKEEPTDIDVSKVTNNQKWRVTWNGKDVYNMEKVGISKTKLIAITLEELINRDGKKCRRCGREEYLTIDHVVPVSFIRDMGIPEYETYADKENLELLCKICNGFKANRFDWSNPRTKAVLLRLLENV
ncbi:MAG: HNH endonuclease [Candidatus Paceibacterota bacterium]|jgi:hypothetical protein